MDERKSIFNPEDGQFRGPEEFTQRMGQFLDGQLVRVYNYGAMAADEPYYVVGPGDKLYDARSYEEVDPRVVLSRDGAQNGWCFERADIGALPEKILIKALKR